MALREPMTAGEFSIVRLPQEIDLGNASEVLESMLSTLNRGNGDLVVDARDVRFMDSSGLNALVRARERADALSGSLHLVAASSRMRRLLEITRLTGLLRRVDTVEDAVACLAGRAAGQDCRHPR